MDTVGRLKELISLKANNEPVRIISHSLGGIVSIIAAQDCPQIKKIVTMGTPFGGSTVAAILRWFVPITLFQEIQTNSAIIKSLKCPEIPVRSFVTKDGNNPLINEPNDGVVTVKSQLALAGPEYINVNLNHFEVLLSNQVVNDIESFLF
jgi:pimeloyl-ACP methyl ester carboxylesterase